MRPSTTALVEALLAEIGSAAPTPGQRVLLKRAREDYYNDFFGEPAMPIAQLVADARAADLPRVAEKAIAGNFDATREESDEWRQSPEGQETFRQLTEER